MLVKITETLSAKFVNYNISFKCHPNDKLDDYEHLKNNFNNVKVIDNKNSNPYEVLSNNYIIIGQHSTMLFEATYFKEKIIFFLKNDVIPKEVGNEFSSIESLVYNINNIKNFKRNNELKNPKFLIGPMKKI